MAWRRAGERSSEPVWRSRLANVVIDEVSGEVGDIELGVAGDRARVNGQPADPDAGQDIASVEVAMQDHRLGWRVGQVAAGGQSRIEQAGFGRTS